MITLSGGRGPRLVFFISHCRPAIPLLELLLLSSVFPIKHQCACCSVVVVLLSSCPVFLRSLFRHSSHARLSHFRRRRLYVGLFTMYASLSTPPYGRLPFLSLIMLMSTTMWTRSLRFLAFLALVVMLMLTHAVMYARMLLNRRGPVQSLFLLGSSPLYY